MVTRINKAKQKKIEESQQQRQEDRASNRAGFIDNANKGLIGLYQAGKKRYPNVTNAATSLYGQETVTPKEECEARGWNWNAKTQSCENPNVQPLPSQFKTDEQEDVLKAPLGYKGNIIKRDGKTYQVGNETPFAFSKATSQDRSDVERVKAGELTFEQEQQAQARAQRLQELFNSGGITEQELSLLQEAPIDWGQALTAGALSGAGFGLGQKILGGRMGGVAGGAGLAGVATYGGSRALGTNPRALGTNPRAIAAGVGVAGASAAFPWVTVAAAALGLASGVVNNIKSQQKGEIAAANKVLTDAKSNLRQIRMMAQADPSKAEQAVELYVQQMNLVRIAHRKLQLETQGNLNKFMEDGTEDLAAFELFLMPGGYADLQKMRLEEAIASQKPATPEELVFMYQEILSENEE